MREKLNRMMSFAKDTRAIDEDSIIPDFTKEMDYKAISFLVVRLKSFSGVSRSENATLVEI
jgi:hypothetical protein